MEDAGLPIFRISDTLQALGAALRSGEHAVGDSACPPALVECRGETEESEKRRECCAVQEDKFSTKKEHKLQECCSCSSDLLLTTENGAPLQDNGLVLQESCCSTQDRVPRVRDSWEKVWYKESSPRNLRSRDFFAPLPALKKLFRSQEVPGLVRHDVMAIQGPAVLPVSSCVLSEIGLLVQIDRPLVFQRVLEQVPSYLQPGQPFVGSGHNLVLNCAPLYGPPRVDSLQLTHIRAVLITDHLAYIFRRCGFSVSLSPILDEGSDVGAFLELLGVNWPHQTNGTGEEDLWETLKNSPYVMKPCQKEAEQHLRLDLRRFIEEKALTGFDPNIGACLVQDHMVKQLAELQKAVSLCGANSCEIIHVVCCEEEYLQQQVDLLWQLAGTRTTVQKHLVCGPVKAAGLSAHQYFEVRFSQMKEASVSKYGFQVQGESWEEIIRVMTYAAVKFELLTTAHRSPVTLDVRKESSLSTKSMRSGAFVMYNCARLATLFQNYFDSIQQGLYPEMPEPSQISTSSLRDEGEWQLLFNYVVPFPELQDQVIKSLDVSTSIRINLGTELMSRFLVALSMDFSSYYNRVHVLGEPLPHLFAQMFARLQLLKAVREIFHTVLQTLHIPSLPQV
ncbi:DALR anticodon-binding domain-containing protein 3 [Erpetoichthys calabaricus]|uniref:DALR anticodon-binding domain-containing protein 3 n=1 Tax=Erpetoichthys calabaricus TaxID=27687 RepID=UPI0022346E7E|nr:DALR anticodon-binding domain-containing protein 3 [Erpetoichthys calabaricus]